MRDSRAAEALSRYSGRVAEFVHFRRSQEAWREGRALDAWLWPESALATDLGLRWSVASEMAKKRTAAYALFSFLRYLLWAEQALVIPLVADLLNSTRLPRELRPRLEAVRGEEREHSIAALRLWDSNRPTELVVANWERVPYFVEVLADAAAELEDDLRLDVELLVMGALEMLDTGTTRMVARDNSVHADVCKFARYHEEEEARHREHFQFVLRWKIQSIPSSRWERIERILPRLLLCLVAPDPADHGIIEALLGHEGSRARESATDRPRAASMPAMAALTEVLTQLVAVGLPPRIGMEIKRNQL
jgi:hypothetical protein